MCLMKVRASKSQRGAIGVALLAGYLGVVAVIAVLRALTGWPTVAELASTPALLAHGEWWRLITSALVVNGPPLPQMIAIAVLGSAAIYFGGSAVFWSAAVAGHVIGTLAAYVGLSAAWISARSSGSRLLTDPDYGVSLIWCAALGAFAAMACLGAGRNWRRPQYPWLAVGAVLVLGIVTAFSDRMAAVQHIIAFVVGFVVLALAGRPASARSPRRPRPT
jgi:hypothetical protein